MYLKQTSFNLSNQTTEKLKLTNSQETVIDDCYKIQEVQDKLIARSIELLCTKVCNLIHLCQTFQINFEHTMLYTN